MNRHVTVRAIAPELQVDEELSLDLHFDIHTSGRVIPHQRPAEGLKSLVREHLASVCIPLSTWHGAVGSHGATQHQLEAIKGLEQTSSCGTQWKATAQELDRS